VLEQSFARDLSHVRVHENAAERGEAVTLGSDIYFAPGRFRPATTQGLWLLAHETAHVIQQETPGGGTPGLEAEHSASRAATHAVQARPADPGSPVAHGPQAFVGSEHRDIGQEATGGTVSSDVNIGTDVAPTFLSFGEVVMLAADYFESIDELRRVARDPQTRPQVVWARWWALNPRGGPGEPAVSPAIKQTVRERYFRLAAANVAHFSAGGTAQNEYEAAHYRALLTAFRAGVTRQAATWNEAMTTEAFADHYLTDMFSAGHIRTPRAELRTWYMAHYPRSTTDFVRFMAGHMHTFLVTTHDWVAAHQTWPGVPHLPTVAELERLIQTVGGPAIGAFSLGDIVSLAIHNRDSRGLAVVSDVDATGTRPLDYPQLGGVRVAGPPMLDVHRWTAVGDERLSTSPETRQMAVAAVRASVDDLNTMRAAGDAAAGTARVSTPQAEAQFEDAFRTTLDSLRASSTATYRAEQFIPRLDPASPPYPLHWEWGSFDSAMRSSVDDAVKRDVAAELRSIAAARTDADERAALNDFAALLARDGIGALETAIGVPAGP
jgi:hypothetical protein